MHRRYFKNKARRIETGSGTSLLRHLTAIQAKFSKDYKNINNDREYKPDREYKRIGRHVIYDIIYRYVIHMDAIDKAVSIPILSAPISRGFSDYRALM